MFSTKNIVKKTVPFVVSSLILLSLNSCATIFGDNTRTVAVNSHPQGAGVYVEGQRFGTTPTQVTLPT